MVHDAEDMFRSSEQLGATDGAAAVNERVRAIAGRVISDVRAAVVDLRITEAEIHTAAEFFNALGRAGEFPDLLDIFLAVTSVVATEGASGGTTPNLAGPYYRPGAPRRPQGHLYDGAQPLGSVPLTVHGTVTHVETGAPIPGLELDVWQADGHGEYDTHGYQLRGLVPTNADGTYEFKSVLPEGYEIPAKGPTTDLLRLMGQTTWRPAHIHLRANVAGEPVFQTQFFIAGARYLDCDPVDAVRDDLVLPAVADPSGEGMVINFDIKINPDRPAGIAYDKTVHKS